MTDINNINKTKTIVNDYFHYEKLKLYLTAKSIEQLISNI